MMSLHMAPPLPVIFLLVVSGASGAQWSVKYNQQEICALNGSTVFMNGTYTHPEGLTVTEEYWIIDPVKEVKLTVVCNPDYSGRVECFTDEQKHFSLKLSDVMKKDEHQYCFRIVTDKTGGNWLGYPGVTLTVTDLHVEPSEEVIEGETAVLTCKTTCSLTDPTFIWNKDGRPLTTKTMEKNQLHLQAVSSEDAGSYSCAVRGHEHLPSPAQALRVRYPPKNISVSISPSGEIVEGSSVTLTCSSDANPPVEIYTWFKMGTNETLQNGRKQNYTIRNVSSEDDGKYWCLVANSLGSQSSEKTLLSVPYAPKKVNVSESKTVGGNSVTLTCSSDANPPVENYTWFREGEHSAVGSGHSYSAVQSGSYYCEAQNKHGAQRSDPVSVTLNGGQHAVIYGVIGIVSACVIFSLVFLILHLLVRRKKEEAVVESVKQDDHFSSVAVRDTTNETSLDEVQYESVIHHRPTRPSSAEGPAEKASGSGAAGDILYATVHHRHDKGVEKTVDTEVQYASVKFPRTNRSAAPTFDDPSVIYSSVI